MKHIGNFKNSLGTSWEHIGIKKNSKIHEISHLIHNIDTSKGVEKFSSMVRHMKVCMKTSSS
jgi:hypothetical protein